jgi:hypothetical protein
VRDQIDCRIESGEHLRFTLFKEGRPLSPMGGNFLYVRDGEDGPVILYAGQTDNLALHAQERWGEAASSHGAQGLYTRLNITGAVRQREHLDLLEALDPPMNAGEPRADKRGHGIGKDGAAANGF